MRKVVVVDGTHLKAKYGGCLITACTEDGNRQIFPLAFAIVDSENDAAYEWFFRKLAEIVPVDSDVVFISDRHSSVYSDLRKVKKVLAGYIFGIWNDCSFCDGDGIINIQSRYIQIRDIALVLSTFNVTSSHC